MPQLELELLQLDGTPLGMPVPPDNDEHLLLSEVRLQEDEPLHRKGRDSDFVHDGVTEYPITLVPLMVYD